jgi:hypothetical protein
MNEEPSTNTEPSVNTESSTSTETEDVVRTLLRVSGIAPDDSEVAVLVNAFPTLRESIARLYAIPDVRYGSPGLIFDADPAFVAWG